MLTAIANCAYPFTLPSPSKLERANKYAQIGDLVIAAIFVTVGSLIAAGYILPSGGAGAVALSSIFIILGILTSILPIMRATCCKNQIWVDTGGMYLEGDQIRLTTGSSE